MKINFIKEAYEDIAKTAERFRRPGVIFSESQKDKIKKIAIMERHTPSTNSFNLTNFSSADLHKMIQTDDLPLYLTSNQKERIKELYKQGHTFDSVRKLKGLIEDQSTRPGKTTL